MSEKGLFRETAADLMARHVVAVGIEDTLRQALDVLVENHVSGAPVLDAEDRCVGVITASDILGYERDQAAKADARGEKTAPFFDEGSQQWEEVPLSAFSLEEFADVAVAEAMSRNVESVAPATGIVDIARLMAEKSIHRVLVIDNRKKVAGIVTSMDIVRRLARGED